MENQNIWDKQHEKYAQSDWIGKPSLFAEWAKGYFPKQGAILELGCGQGQDSRYFAGLAYSVTALDSSEKGIAYAKEKTPEDLAGQIKFKVADISQPLDFSDISFEIVYSHLALHYFDTNTTEKLFSEIYRVLKKSGILAFLVNSTSDPEYGTGKKIEDDYFEIKGIKKRFFDTESVKQFARNFESIVLDDRGETYKDRAISTDQLIRYIGKKQ